MKNSTKFILGLCAVFSTAALAQFFPIEDGAIPFGDSQRNFTSSQPDLQFNDTTKQLLVGITASATYPAYSFPGVGNNDNGLWRSGTDEISLVTAGQNRLTIGPTGIISFGTSSPPFVRLTGDTMSGNLSAPNLRVSDVSGIIAIGTGVDTAFVRTSPGNLFAFGNISMGGTSNIALSTAYSPSLALIEDSNRNIVPSSTTAAELAFLSGATANIQAQINNFSAGTGFVLKIGDTMAGKLVNASGFVGPVTGNVNGNLTGNVTGNLTGNVLGTVTGNVTGSAALNVLKSGDSMSGALNVGAQGIFSTSGSNPLTLNRTDDGDTLITRRAGITSGSISHSATGFRFGADTDFTTEIGSGGVARLLINSAGLVTAQTPTNWPFVVRAGDTMTGTLVGTTLLIGDGGTAGGPFRVKSTIAGALTSLFENPSSSSSAQTQITLGTDSFSTSFNAYSSSSAASNVPGLTTSDPKGLRLNSSNGGPVQLSIGGVAVLKATTGLAVNIPALTASRAIVTNASSDLAASSVLSSELAFLSGVTANVQTQLNALSGPFVSKTGDSMSGTLLVGASVNATLEASKYLLADRVMIGVGTGYGANNLYLGTSDSTITSGNNNTAVGSAAGDAMTTGTHNTMVGRNAGTTITIGAQNTVVGSGAGGSLSSANFNTLIGYNAMPNATTSSENTVVGNSACSGISVGAASRAVCIGKSAGISLTTAIDVVLIGVSATGTGNPNNSIAIGTKAQVTASSAVLLGSGVNSTANSLQFDGFNFLRNTGDANFKSLAVTGGANTKLNTITLTGVSTFVANTAVTANSQIFLTPQNNGASVSTSAVWIGAKSAGSSFVIQSASASEDRSCAYFILEQQ